jgi:hypothetical protein
MGCSSGAGLPGGDVPASGPPASVGPYLKHDFGIVAPGERLTHRFRIENGSDIEWAFEQIIADCSCTVADLSQPVIAPGGDGYVDVAYTAPGGYADELRRLGVRFADAKAPLIWLEIQAKIRHPVSVLPRKVDLDWRTGGGDYEGFIEVHNYLDEPMSLASVTATEGWVVVGEPTEFREGAENGPTQVWRIPIRGEAGGLGPGEHHASLVVAVAGAESDPPPVEVNMTVARPVEPVPSRIFFGTVTRGQASRSTVGFILAPEHDELDPGEFVLQHDLGDQLEVALVSGAGTGRWELTASLTPSSESPRLVKGTVTLRTIDEHFSPIEIPVLARVKDQ